MSDATDLAYASLDAEAIAQAAVDYHRMVGAFLRIERERQGVTAAQAAARVGRSASWASKIERGVNDSHQSAYVYAKALGLSLGTLVKMAEDASATRAATR